MTATENLTLPREAEPYVAAVRALLSSLQADERDELFVTSQLERESGTTTSTTTTATDPPPTTVPPG